MYICMLYALMHVVCMYIYIYIYIYMYICICIYIICMRMHTCMHKLGVLESTSSW